MVVEGKVRQMNGRMTEWMGRGRMVGWIDGLPNY